MTHPSRSAPVGYLTRPYVGYRSRDARLPAHPARPGTRRLSGCRPTGPLRAHPSLPGPAAAEVTSGSRG